MWLCCPSILSPEVGPKVVSDAGEPASPSAAEAASITIICSVLNPSFKHKGTKSAASIGMVPNEVPMPIVINKPNSKIINDVKQ